MKGRMVLFYFIASIFFVHWYMDERHQTFPSDRKTISSDTAITVKKKFITKEQIPTKFILREFIPYVLRELLSSFSQ